MRFANGGASIIPKLTAVQGYDYEKDKDVKLDSDGSVPFNWAGWDIRKIELGQHTTAGDGDASTVYVTLTNKSKQDVVAEKATQYVDWRNPGGTLMLTGFKDGKGSESYIKLPLCVPVSTDSPRGVDEGESETIKAGETKTCLGEMYLTNDDGSPTADSFRPWYMSFEADACDANNDKFDSCHDFGTKQDIKLTK
ncbi:hypothetical protein [Bifidobacterium myosotis]|uniref:Uncharacterized protein n=1 Tax=Bifidobacterium myosotis TaxID=1630166 RepID=A0A5M9ZJQ9_9BIFI|nr:hypothetical protein [Bifidobacterium myosotis]KAA8827800.1 hypothetical protein EMO91_08220 [Bifidobacterium myosotis]